MKAYLVVFLGSGLGGLLRHAVNVAMARLAGTAFPYQTITVNVVGSLVMGILAGYFATKGATQPWKLFLVTGVLGGFTTFSAFSLDASVLYERGDFAQMAGYVLVSVVAAIAALFVGLYVARNLT